ncbi:MAG TPA: hypothetical protein DG754_00885 [Bacteroidales bacterium]|jgi:HSP20 family protein|nr:hypothetical protein [Bacteroidales bacterium]
MTLLSISRPSALKTSQNRNEYGDFVKRFAQAVDRYAADCKNIPAVNIIEEPEAYKIQLVAPGFSKDEFSINIEKEVLTVSANVPDEQKQIKYLLNEFTKCEFSRSFTLGKTVDTEKVDAEYKNGVLTISLSKSEEAKVKPPRNIAVN